MEEELMQVKNMDAQVLEVIPEGTNQYRLLLENTVFYPMGGGQPTDHGKKPFIVYQGVLNKDIKEKLEEKTNELVEKNLKFSWIFQPLEELQKEAIYLQPGLPTDKPLRTLRLETVGAVADGGTQVRTTKEVGNVIIGVIERQNGQTTIHYLLQM